MNSKSKEKYDEIPSEANGWAGFEMASDIREGMEYKKRLDFEYITEDAENKAKFDFIIENNARGAIQHRQSLGWRVWKGEKYAMTEFDREMQANRVDKGYACAAAGECGDGKPSDAYLMYIPKGHPNDIANSERRKARIAERNRQGAGIGDPSVLNSKVAGFEGGQVSVYGAHFNRTTSDNPNPAAGINQITNT